MVSVNLGVLHYVLDHIYGTILHRTKIGTPFFSKGWGGTNLELLERMVNQLFPNAGSLAWPPALIKLAWKTKWETNNACLKECIFASPCEEELLCVLPPESRTARAAFLVPKSVPVEKMACVVHLAGIVKLLILEADMYQHGLPPVFHLTGWYHTYKNNFSMFWPCFWVL
jgi:Alpha/beta hydrolase domain containing 18